MKSVSLFNKLTFPIIVEIGSNHEGSLDKALELTQLAYEAGAKIIKFQSYTLERFIAAHDMTRRERIKKFRLSQDDFEKIFEFTQKLGVQFLSTPVTEDWVELLEPFCSIFKIASGDITFKPVIQKAARTGKPLIISTGAASIEEIDQAVSWVEQEVGAEHIKEQLILMHCVSAYPTPIEEANILSIPFLKERYGLRVGYSNHVIGINACLAAVALGADVIEVHFTDRKEEREFRDHALSFDQNDLKAFIHASNEIYKSLGQYRKEVQSCESNGVSMLRKGIVAARDIKIGEVISESDLMFARPATEFSSQEIHLLIGKKLKVDVLRGYLIPRNAI